MGLSPSAVFRVIDAAKATKTRVSDKGQQMRNEIVALYEAGVGSEAIARQLQVERTTVNRVLKGAEISPRSQRGPVSNEGSQ